MKSFGWFLKALKEAMDKRHFPTNNQVTEWAQTLSSYDPIKVRFDLLSGNRLARTLYYHNVSKAQIFIP